MAQFDICAYKDQALHGAGTGILDNDGTLTGHHIIPDHCFYYTSGLRGKGDLSGFLCPTVRAYTTADAPVILLSADNNGGKSRNHGLVHVVFDPIELKAARANGNQWTYERVRAAAIESITTNCTIYSEAQIQKVLDDYFITTCGIALDTLIRAGEHGTMRSAPPPRKSHRYKPY